MNSCNLASVMSVHCWMCIVIILLALMMTYMLSNGIISTLLFTI